MINADDAERVTRCADRVKCSGACTRPYTKENEGNDDQSEA